MPQTMVIFVIAVLGYILGSIRVSGVSLGSSGVMIVALIFGHFGFQISDVVKDLGLVLFVGSVGFMAGPTFFRSFKNHAKAYIVTGFVIVSAGLIVTIAATHLFDLPGYLGIGIMCGAMTSTPGLAAAIEATGNDMASVGYGIAYPFGVVASVLFVQLIPVLGKFDIEEESSKLTEKFGSNPSEAFSNRNLRSLPLPCSDLLIFSLAMILGYIIAAIKIPLPGGGAFSLGVSGGPLLSGLLLGHVGRIGDFSITPPKKTIETLREFGLMLFLLGAGIGAGAGFIHVVSEYGIMLFLIGAVIIIAALVAGYLAARKIFKLSLFDALGCVCGGNTSTPSLGALMNVAGNDFVVASYAAAYPSALIFIVLACQVFAIVMGV